MPPAAVNSVVSVSASDQNNWLDIVIFCSRFDEGVIYPGKILESDIFIL